MEIQEIKNVIKEISSEPLHGTEFYTNEMLQELAEFLYKLQNTVLKDIGEMNIEEKITTINEYIKNNTKLNSSYSDALKTKTQINKSQLKYRTAYSALIEGEAICVGITELSRILLKMYEIESHTHLALCPDSRDKTGQTYKPFFHYLVEVDYIDKNKEKRRLIMDAERQGNRERKAINRNPNITTVQKHDIFENYMKKIIVIENVPEEFVKNKVGFSGLGIEFSKIRELIKTPAVNGNYDGLVADLEPQYRKEKLNSKIRGFQSKNKEIEDDDNIR